jgi:hypothetical protein
MKDRKLPHPPAALQSARVVLWLMILQRLQAGANNTLARIAQATSLRSVFSHLGAERWSYFTSASTRSCFIGWRRISSYTCFRCSFMSLSF